MIGQLAVALQRDDDEPHMLGAEPTQPAAEDVGGAQQLCRGRVGRHRLAARGHHDVGRGQTVRVDAEAQPQDQRRGDAEIDELRQRARRHDEAAAHLEADCGHRPQPADGGEHTFGLVVVARFAVGQQQGGQGARRHVLGLAGGSARGWGKVWTHAVPLQRCGPLAPDGLPRSAGGPGRNSNLQPDGYEPPALTIELRAPPANGCASIASLSRPVERFRWALFGQNIGSQSSRSRGRDREDVA